MLDDTGIVSVLGWPDVSHAIAERKHGLALGEWARPWVQEQMLLVSCLEGVLLAP